MSKIVILGGTGYTGSAIVAEAAARGFDVVSVSRSATEDKIEGVNYIEGSVLDNAIRSKAFDGADVVIAALSPRADMAGKVVQVYKAVIEDLADSDTRLFIIGGFGSLKLSADSDRIVNGDDFEPAYKPEALELLSVLDSLQSSAPEALDWLYVSPAATYGAFNPGEKRGNYTVSGDVALFDANGESNLSNFDLATALVDEIENPAHHKEHISIAY
ncbi:NAD(P)H-binding protein [soil metagenome]